MIRFEAMLQRDARAVFLNTAEFARQLEVDGRAVRAMWDDSMRSGMVGSSGGLDESMYGVNVERRVLLALAADMPKPVPGQELEIDGNFWIVGPVADQHGVLSISLSRNLS
jgi:hypothetical protein